MTTRWSDLGIDRVYTVKSKLSAGNSSIKVSPSLRANILPLLVLADLEDSIRSVSEPQVTIGAIHCVFIYIYTDPFYLSAKLTHAKKKSVVLVT